MARKETDEGYLEVQMDGKQVVMIIAGILLLCAISFYFGRRVGRVEAARVGGDVLPIASGATEAIADEENAGEDLTFFDTLGERPQPVKPLPVASGSNPESKAPTTESTPSVPEASPTPTEPPAKTPVKAAETPPPAKTPVTPTATGLEIQVGVFSQRNQAESLASRLRAKGYRPSISPTNTQGKTVYRVRVGGYANRAAAESAASRLQAEEKLQTWIPPQGG